MNKFFRVATVVCVLALAACGGGGSDPVAGAATDLTISIDETNGRTAARAVVNEDFVFAAVPAFGTTGTTTLTFTDTAATPAFSITSGGNTASGVTVFGSCEFNVTESTFPAGSPLAEGETVVIEACALQVDTSGAPANGASQARTATLSLDGAPSQPIAVVIEVQPNGDVELNGEPVGEVPVRDLTGG
ncbi:MAG TPA: hypothetical protein VIL30_14900 [Ramlibacter sp.]